MTRVGTFRESSTYPNQQVVFDNEVFTIEGSGVVDVRHLADFDAKGELDWASSEMRDWAYQRINAASVPTMSFPPTVAQPTQKPFYKQRLFFLLLILAVVVACPLCSFVSFLNDYEPATTGAVTEAEKPSVAQEETEAATEESTEPEVEVEEAEPLDTGNRIGDTVSAGQFEYTVNSVSAMKQIGEEPFSMTTDAEFLVVNATVKNNDSEGRMMASSMFTLLDSQGNKYDADTSAFMYLDEEGSLFFENVNPGLARTGSIVFEVPEGLSGLSLEVDSGIWFASGKTAVIKLDR